MIGDSVQKLGKDGGREKRVSKSGKGLRKKEE